ncbi:MAG: type II toxin-antitoxin system RatA family toxin [bacterium]
MVNIKRSRKIKGDPIKLWQLINQVERYPEWLPGVVEARITSNPSDNNSGLGRQQLIKTDMKLGKGESLQEVIAWEPPHKITWQHLKDVVDGKEFKHAKEIKTTLSITNNKGEVTFRMVGSWKARGISGQIMNRFMKRIMAKNFEKAFNNLEKILNNETART